jgi:hypothetical protein
VEAEEYRLLVVDKEQEDNQMNHKDTEDETEAINILLSLGQLVA